MASYTVRFNNEGKIFACYNCYATKYLSALPATPRVLPLSGEYSPRHLRKINFQHQLYPFLAFIPIRPSYEGPILGRFANVEEHIVKDDDGWHLEDEYQQSWLRIGTAVRMCARLMWTNSINQPPGMALREFTKPERYGYLLNFDRKEDAIQRVRESREAFLPLFAMLTFCVALYKFGQTQGTHDPEGIPYWYRLLLDAKVSPGWLDGLCNSQILDFYETKRVGLIIDFTLLEDKSILDKGLWWFLLNKIYIKAGVPVYINWGYEWNSVAENPYHEKYRPTKVEFMEAVDNYLTWRKLFMSEDESDRPRPLRETMHAKFWQLTPYDDSLQQLEPDPSPVRPPKRARYEFTPEVEGLAIQDGAVPEINMSFDSLENFYEWEHRQKDFAIKNETPKTRQSRISRAGNASLLTLGDHAHTSVFVLWVDKHERLRWGKVIRNCWDDCWVLFAATQRRYNEYNNWWTLSKLFAPGDEPQDSYNDDIAPDDFSPPPPDPDTDTANVEESLHVNVNIDMNCLYPEQYHIKEWECPDNLETILYARYAFKFKPDLSQSQSAALPSIEGLEGRLSKYAKAIGSYLLCQKELIAQGEKYRQMEAFVHSICESNRDNAQYQIFLDSFAVSDGKIKIEYFGNDRGQKPLYSINPVGQQSDVPWILVVSNLVTAYEVVRRDWGGSIRNIAHQLILRGIPFHTLINEEAVKKISGDIYVPSKHSYTQPIIWSDFQQALQNCDRNLYFKRIKDILFKRHGRKALLMGGIIWRWATEFLQPEDALEGPSPDCVLGDPICVRSDGRYYDDFLDPIECGIILGSYRSYTGLGSQTEDVSIFPLPNTQREEGVGIYYWAPRDESWFRKQVDSDLTLKQNKGSWRKSMRPTPAQRHSRKNIEDHAAHCFAAK